MNARKFDEGIIAAQVWFIELMEEFHQRWQGDRLRREEDGNTTQENLYGEEERSAAQEPGSDLEPAEE